MSQSPLPSLPTARRDVLWNPVPRPLPGGAERRLWSGGRELESVAFGCSSLHSEPTGLFHRYQQLLVELFVRLIRWNVDPVKAGTGQKGESHCWLLQGQDRAPRRPLGREEGKACSLVLRGGGSGERTLPLCTFLLNANI